ncbi:HlyD family type I secretion periplasmic adaptor subunit [Ancylobacter sonchi]|uniref:HlyD family type I secretion periplasmic adaptor subunit n=1 Tax=Ancylobacter sonchi TaxID=1937790 RepID=UPI001BD43E00|nr:HlyD family type I secretion periplasmic adaptor subunit [Ancylobacter sonchi]MBS7536925.1 HlyD family type I secretion periplasmic adaptor subunit [Ancylobacter sonchi]
MTDPTYANPHRSIRRHLALGLLLVVVVVFGIGGWAVATQISGAVIAPGQIVVSSSLKKVQHPTGGIVGELLVKEGDSVHAGDVLLRLDKTVAEANLAILSNNLDEFEARQARNEAERDGAAELVFDEDLLARAEDPDVARILAGEKKLFDTRRFLRDGRKAQLEERIAQLKEEIHGLEFQLTSKTREIEFIGTELKSVRQLWSDNLVSIQRVTALERDGARLEGEKGLLIANIAQTRGRIVETQLQILQIDQDMRSEVATELADLRAKLSETRERIVTARDQLSRVEIRAPQDGVIHQMAAHTIGGVVGPGEPIMLVVPNNDQLEAEARVAPPFIDQLAVGQPAVVRLSAMAQWETPELAGTVGRISPDIVPPTENGGEGFYSVRITLSPAELARLDGVRLMPGMQLEAFIKTGDRSVLSYLVKPLTDQVARSFRGR